MHIKEIKISLKRENVIITEPIYGKKLEIELKNTSFINEIVSINPSIFDEHSNELLNLYNALKGDSKDIFNNLNLKKCLILSRLSKGSFKKIEVTLFNVIKAEFQYYNEEIIGKRICGNCIYFDRNCPKYGGEYVPQYSDEKCFLFNPRAIDFTNTRCGPRDWAMIAYDLSMKCRYKEALRCYENALELEPSNGGYWHAKGILLLNFKRAHEALNCFEKAMTLGVENKAKVLTQKGRALAALGRDQEALACYEEALQSDPNDTLCLISKGRVFFRAKKYKEAIICYDKVINFNPKILSEYYLENMLFKYEAWGSKAEALCGLQRLDEALHCFTEAINITPQNDPTSASRWWLGKGMLLFTLVREQESLKCLEKAVELDPYNTNAWIWKINMLAGLGKFHDAFLNLMNSRMINPNEFDSEYKKVIKQLTSRPIILDSENPKQKIWFENLYKFLYEQGFVHAQFMEQYQQKESHPVATISLHDRDNFLKSQQQKKTLITQAKDYMTSNNPLKAIEYCEKVLVIDSRCDEIWDILNKIYKNSGSEKICGVCRSYSIGYCNWTKKPIDFLNQKAKTCFYFLRKPFFI